jgi:hypothetical protein
MAYLGLYPKKMASGGPAAACRRRTTQPAVLPLHPRASNRRALGACASSNGVLERCACEAESDCGRRFRRRGHGGPKTRRPPVLGGVMVLLQKTDGTKVRDAVSNPNRQHASRAI